jgi:hypothetical protein
MPIAIVHVIHHIIIIVEQIVVVYENCLCDGGVGIRRLSRAKIGKSVKRAIHSRFFELGEASYVLVPVLVPVPTYRFTILRYLLRSVCTMAY